jgi:signal transduction histidine kinase
MSLQRVRELLATGVAAGHGDDDAARRQWWAALATLQDNLLLQGDTLSGVWLAAPLPALFDPQVLQRLQGWIWAPADLDLLFNAPPALLPSGAGSGPAAQQLERFTRLPLSDDDGTDPLLLVFTPTLQLAMALDGAPGQRRLLLRFEPGLLSDALALIHQRLEQSDPGAATALRQQLHDLGPLHSEAQMAVTFWSRLAARLAAMAPSVTLQPLLVPEASEAAQPSNASGELALLEAITHEVRTPLATIRTLIRSLLRRSDLAALVRQRLEQIDGECSEQIDRFGLIFLAAELQRQPMRPSRGDDQPLARTDLAALLLQLEPLWQRQLSRRGLVFQLELAAELPLVLSDPSRLETMLGGLIDRFSRSLSGGSTVQLSLQAAGNRLKLHLHSDSSSGEGNQPHEQVGPVLSWNPSTGSLQLSRQATRQLFEQLGGRLTERSGSGLTVFFPVC